jgi:hypothetical protein
MSHPIKLSDIEHVNVRNLEDYKLEALKNGKASDYPITLKRSSGLPYQILDGRHRIYLARQQGKSIIAAIFDDER